MNMTLNELLIRHNFLTKLVTKDGDVELSRPLKVKVIGMRVKLGKIRKEFDEDVQEVVKDLTPEGYADIAQKQEKTEEEIAQLEAWNKQINDDVNTYTSKRVQDIMDYTPTFTAEEFDEIIEVNACNDVEINSTKLTAAEFLEVLYSLFVA